jgi:hypothetical protein
MLLIIHFLRIVRSVIEKDLAAVGTRFFQAANGPEIKQVRQAPRTGFVIPGLFIREQKPGILSAALGSGQPPLGIEQDRACMRSKDFGYQ